MKKIISIVAISIFSSLYGAAKGQLLQELRRYKGDGVGITLNPQKVLRCANELSKLGVSDKELMRNGVDKEHLAGTIAIKARLEKLFEDNQLKNEQKVSTQGKSVRFSPELEQMRIIPVREPTNFLAFIKEKLDQIFS